MQFSYDYDGKTYTLQLERDAQGIYSAQVGEQLLRFKAEPVAEGWHVRLLEADDQSSQQALIASAGRDKMRYVQVDGIAYTLNVTERGARQRKTGTGGGDLTAQMPGQVLDVRVNVGDSVENGQVLVVLEAMKMEIRVTAPQTGVVKHILVSKGEIVERGQRLVELAES